MFALFNYDANNWKILDAAGTRTQLSQYSIIFFSYWKIKNWNAYRIEHKFKFFRFFLSLSFRCFEIELALFSYFFFLLAIHSTQNHFYQQEKKMYICSEWYFFAGSTFSYLIQKKKKNKNEFLFLLIKIWFSSRCLFQLISTVFFLLGLGN